jgi:hypothetical protein
MLSKRNTLALWVTAALTAAVLILIVLIPEPRDSLRARVAKLQTEVVSRRFSRATFGGKTSPGNAREEYGLAFSEAQAFQDLNGSIFEAFAAGNAATEDAATALRLLAERASVIEHLRLGTKRQDGQYPYAWDLVSQMRFPNGLDTIKVANFTASQARVLTRDGHARQAMDLALDLTVFAGDLATNGTLFSDTMGAEVYSKALDAIRDTILSGKLAPEELAELADRLETVERDLPDQATAFSNETLVMGYSLLEYGRGVDNTKWIYLMMSNGGWRYGFSTEALTVHFFEEDAEFMKRAGKLGQMDFASATKEIEAIARDADASANPVRRSAAGDPHRASRGWHRSLTLHRTVLAKIRLLRAAALWKATGKLRKLPDPFGTDLMTKEEGGILRIWSAGSDGKDQAGQGSWDLDPDGPSDIVLEIPLRLRCGPPDIPLNC